MATEKKLIDVNALIAYFGEQYNLAMDDPDPVSGYVMSALRCCIEHFKTIPTVDAVEVPCKTGDTVWCIQNNFGRPIAKQGVVSQMYFGEDMRLGFRVKGLCGGEWGERVFATREEAEAAIGERRTDD